MSRNFTNRRFCKLRLESLENRTVPANGPTNLFGGNVGVIVIGGDLHVTGDSAANSVAIVQTQNNGSPVSGSFYIAGLNGTTINGSAANTVAKNTFTGVTRDFIIDMKGGGDKLLFGPDPTISQPSADKFIVPRDLNLDMGVGGADAYVYANGITVNNNARIVSGNSDTSDFHIRGNFFNDVYISTDADSAYITMWNGFVVHDVAMQIFVDSKLQQDIALYDMNIGHDLNIISDPHADFTYVHLDTVSVDNYLNINVDESNAQVDLTDVTAATLKIDARGGLAGTNNRVDLDGVTITTTTTLNGGDGRDRFNIQGVFGGSLTVNGGTANDTVLINKSTVGNLTVTEASLASEHDVVTLSSLRVNGSASITTGAGVDTVSLDHINIYSRLTIDTGDREDSVTLTSLVADEIFALLGAGNDSLSLTSVQARRWSLDGGFGTNTLRGAINIPVGQIGSISRFQNVS